ncbi:MAG TPA: hypothetical protein VI685_02580 [Candidatus Angelobacter sp.]
MKYRLLTLILTMVTLPCPSLDKAHFMDLNKHARELATQKNWKELREALLEIGRAMPAPTPLYFLRMASVEARLGNKDEALRWMEKYAAMGLRFDVAKDDDLKSLNSPALTREMAEHSNAIEKPELVCTLPLPNLMPEDLTFDKTANSFVVSSIQHHTLYRVTPPKSGAGPCTLKEIPLEEQARRWPVLAVSADSTRKLLWMTASAMAGFTGVTKEDEGKASLLAIDGTTGKVVRRFDLSDSNPAVLGDMSVAADGTVYVTDSIGGGVYRVRGHLARAKLEKIAGDFFSPQTPVVAGDGKRLFVGDYSMGIAVVDLIAANQPGQLNYLPHPENVAVTGLDGLYLSGDSLIGIQNGTDPERIVRYHLNSAQTEITSCEVIEQSTQRLGDPTHVIEWNGWFYVSANVGWNKVDDQGQLKSGEHFTSPILLRFR